MLCESIRTSLLVCPSFGETTNLVLFLPSSSDASSSSPIHLHALYEPLKASLNSHSRNTRLAVLRLLSSLPPPPPPPSLPQDPDSISHSQTDGVVEIVKRCLQAEEIPVGVQGVRERVLKIGRVSQVLRDEDEESGEVLVRWLVGASSSLFSSGSFT